MSPSPSKSQLVILDAGVVIEAFRTNSWAALIKRYAVVVSRTVMTESMFFFDPVGARVPIYVQPYEASGEITVVDVPASDLAAFLAGFDPGYAERLHAGELESLCFLMKQPGAEAKICSADSIVFKVLGKLRLSAQGISLEELLMAAGCPKTMHEKYGKAFRERWTSAGFSDSFS